MKKFILLAMIFSTLAIYAEDRELEKRQNESIEKFIVANRKSDGNFTTIPLKNWQNKIGIPFLSAEDLIRKILNNFELHYKSYKILNYQVVACNKLGLNGGTELDFIIIQHESRTKRTYRLENKDPDEL